MKKDFNYFNVLREALILTGVMAIIAAAVYFFLVPSHTSISSMSGLGIVLTNFIPLPLSTITMILNVVLLIVGFLTCGKEFGVKTKLATTSSTGGLSLALQRAIVTARPKGRYRKHFYWPAIKRYYWNLLFSIPLLAHLYISELLHLLYCRLFQHNIL